MGFYGYEGGISAGAGQVQHEEQGIYKFVTGFRAHATQFGTLAADASTSAVPGSAVPFPKPWRGKRTFKHYG